MECMIEVDNELANSWTFDKTKWLEIIESKLFDARAKEHTKSQVATIASKCS